MLVCGFYAKTIKFLYYLGGLALVNNNENLISSTKVMGILVIAYKCRCGKEKGLKVFMSVNNNSLQEESDMEYFKESNSSSDDESEEEIGNLVWWVLTTKLAFGSPDDINLILLQIYTWFST